MPKEAIYAIGAVTLLAQGLALSLYISTLKLEIATLIKDKQELATTLGDANLRVTTLQKSKIKLEKEIEESNVRVAQQQKLQVELQTKGKIQEEAAKLLSLTYLQKIEALKARQPQGTTECEKILSVLQDF